MVKGDKKLAMGDCAINIAPNEDELAESLSRQLRQQKSLALIQR